MIYDATISCSVTVYFDATRIGALTHNNSYPKKGSCVKISVTEGGKSDTTQHNGIHTGTTKPIFSVIKRREGQDAGRIYSGYGLAPQGGYQVAESAKLSWGEQTAWSAWHVQGCKAVAYSHLGSQRSAVLKAVTAVSA